MISCLVFLESLYLQTATSQRAAALSGENSTEGNLHNQSSDVRMIVLVLQSDAMFERHLLIHLLCDRRRALAELSRCGTKLPCANKPEALFEAAVALLSMTRQSIRGLV